MSNNYLKLSFSIFIILVMLFAPLTFNIFSDDNAYAMAGGGGGKKKGKRGLSHQAKVNKDNKDEDSGKFGEYVFIDGNNPAGVQTPEPATLLLLSGGAAGLVVLRKKLKK